MSLIQEALKRKEHDEAQNKPEAGSAEKVPAVSPPGDVKLSLARQPAAEVKNTGIPLSSPLQSMPVAGPTQSAASQSILTPRSAITLPDSADPAPPERYAEASALRPGERDGESAELAPGEAALKAGPSAQPGRRTASFLWVIVAAVAILTALTVTAGFVFFFYHLLLPVKVKIGQPAPRVHSEAAERVGKTGPTAGGTNIVIGQPLSAGRRATAGSAEATPHQVIAPDEKDAKKEIVTAESTQTVAVTQNAVQQQSPGKPVSVKSGLRQGEPPPVRAKTPPESSADVKWPVLKLTGILRGSGPTESTAFINGKMISAGQMIDDVTILEIQADRVLLKHGAEKRFLRVGATLY